MPSLNRYNELLGPQQYISNYVELPFQNILQIGAMKQQMQDQNTAEAMSYLGKNWNMLPGDNPRALELRNELESRLKDYAYNKDFNDPNVRAAWYKDRMDIAKQFSPNGEIGRQQLNYDNYKAYEKDLLSKSKELGWSSDQLQQHLNQAKNSFLTRGESGELNYFQGQGLPNYVNQNEWLSKNLKDIAADTGIVGLHGIGNLDELTKAFASGTIESKNANKIINSLALRAQGDPQLLSSLEQEGLFRGQKGLSSFVQGQDKDGNILLNTNTPFGRSLYGVAQGAKYRKEDQKIIQVDDKLGLYEAKKALDEQEVKNGIKATTIQGIPANNLSETNTDSGINTALRTSGNPISKYWEFKNGVPQMVNPSGKEVYNINGKQYTYEDFADQGKNLPAGYKVATVPTAFGVETVIRGPKGEEIRATKADEKDFQLNAYKELLNTANRLGITGSREEVEKGVGDYYRNAYNLQLNFPKFNPGIQKTLSDIYGVKTKVDGDGNLSILDPGQLSFSTLKDVNGNVLNFDGLNEQKINLLSGAKVIGAAQNLTNDKYEAGDMLLQTKDNDIIIINTNDKDWNSRFKPSTDLIKSVNTFVNTGQKNILPEHRADINQYGLTSAISSTRDKEGNDYIVYMQGGKPEVLFLGSDGSSDVFPLDEASKRLVNSNLVDLLPTINSKNFDRASKRTEFDTED